jgi:hypothetical protein
MGLAAWGVLGGPPATEADSSSPRTAAKTWRPETPGPTDLNPF